MFQKWIEEYVSFEEKLIEIIKKNKGNVKNGYVRLNAEFNPQTLRLVNEEIVTICAEVGSVIDEKIAEISFTLMRKLIDEGYIEYKVGLGTVFLYTFNIENFIDFEEALKK